MKKIGIALGAGGAKGLAHVLILEALDELGLKPSYVTGPSTGAVVGVQRESRPGLPKPGCSNAGGYCGRGNPFRAGKPGVRAK